MFLEIDYSRLSAKQKEMLNHLRGCKAVREYETARESYARETAQWTVEGLLEDEYEDVKFKRSEIDEIIARAEAMIDEKCGMDDRRSLADEIAEEICRECIDDEIDYLHA